MPGQHEGADQRAHPVAPALEDETDHRGEQHDQGD